MLNDQPFAIRLSSPAVAAILLTAGMGVVGGPHASADVFRFATTDFGVAATGSSAITFESLETTYDTVSKEFTWSATFSPSTVPGVSRERSLPTGFVLVVNDGPEPKGRVGELAAIYFDGDTNPSDPIISAYAYNGADSATSYRVGVDSMFLSPLVGSAPPDRIVSELDPTSPAFVNSAAVTENTDGTRTLSMSLDASVIQAHVPLYAPYDYVGVGSNEVGPIAEGWFGLGFAQQVGIWFHPYLVGANYDSEGYLVAQGGRDGGWNEGRTDVAYYDVANLPTDLVPEPTTAALLLISGSLFLARRRTA